LEKIPDDWRKIEHIELLLGKGGGNLFAGSGVANRPDFRQVGRLFRRIGQGRRREQGDGVGLAVGQIMHFRGLQGRNGDSQREENGREAAIEWQM
jgi:hypothetical protein